MSQREETVHRELQELTKVIQTGFVNLTTEIRSFKEDLIRAIENQQMEAERRMQQQLAGFFQQGAFYFHHTQRPSYLYNASPMSHSVPSSTHPPTSTPIPNNTTVSNPTVVPPDSLDAPPPTRSHVPPPHGPIVDNPPAPPSSSPDPPPTAVDTTTRPASHPNDTTARSSAPSIPVYRLSRRLRTVTDVWREYAEGIAGGPAVRDLERIHGTFWRKERKESRFFSRRNVIYSEVKRIADEKLISCDHAAQALEKRRTELGVSLDGLGKVIKSTQA
jgi:hypothetical protein